MCNRLAPTITSRLQSIAQSWVRHIPPHTQKFGHSQSQGREHIFMNKTGVLQQQLRFRHPFGQKIQDQRDPYTRASDCRPATADRRIDGDTLKLGFHTRLLSHDLIVTNVADDENRYLSIPAGTGNPATSKKPIADLFISSPTPSNRTYFSFIKPSSTQSAAPAFTTLGSGECFPFTASIRWFHSTGSMGLVNRRETGPGAWPSFPSNSTTVSVAVLP